LIVLKYRDGMGSWEIAELVGRAPATVVRVIQRFRELGEDGLRDHRADNGTPKVDDDVVQVLAEILQRPAQDFGWRRPTWTQELLAKTIAGITGVELSTRTVRRLLRRLRARWGSPRPIVGCPWSKRRKQRRLQAIRETLRTLGPTEVAYFEDEIDIHLNPKIGRDWMLRGAQRRILTPGQNKKRYLAGALSTDGSSLVIVESDRKRTDLFLALLLKLRRRHPEATRIHLILDNYVIHSSRRASRFIEHHGELFVLHFLPPYCPDENRIERLWQDLHANVTRNHRCTTIDQLMGEVHWWLAAERRRRAAHGQRARSTRRRRTA
jgi:transposase